MAEGHEELTVPETPQKQPEQIELATKSIEWLKATCYDQVVIMQRAQQAIQALEAEINKRK